MESKVGVGSNFFFLLPYCEGDYVDSTSPLITPRIATRGENEKEIEPLQQENWETDREKLVSSGEHIDWIPEKPIGNLRFLVVDDSKLVVKLTSKLLSSLGASVSIAENGRQAVDLLAQCVQKGKMLYDVILMDQEMPVMDGLEATKAIRALSPLCSSRRLLIIGCTGHALDNDLQTFEDCGVNCVLTKPLQLNTLNLYIRENISCVASLDWFAKKSNRQSSGDSDLISISSTDVHLERFQTKVKPWDE